MSGVAFLGTPLCISERKLESENHMENHSLTTYRTRDGDVILPQPYPLWASCVGDGMAPTLYRHDDPESVRGFAGLTNEDLRSLVEPGGDSEPHLVVAWEHRHGGYCSWPITADCKLECADCFGLTHQETYDLALRRLIHARDYALWHLARLEVSA